MYLLTLFRWLGVLRFLISKLGISVVVVLVAIYFMTGCSNQPSFVEGSAQLKAETEIAKMDVIRANIGSLRSSVVDIPPYLKEDPPVFPPSELTALKVFLDSHQCEGDPVPKSCLLTTVIYSIELANRTDDTNEQLHGAKVTVNQLIKTLNRIYAILEAQPPDDGK